MVRNEQTGPPEDRRPLGPPIPREAPQKPQAPQPIDDRGTILVDPDGKFSTALPVPPPA